jgi:adenine phosphoribosyltransferase
MFDLRPYIRDVADFPKPGILFKDVTPLLSNPAAFRATIDELKQRFAGRGIDVVAAAEARGFIFGAPLALELGVGFVPIRKPGKLPYAKIAVEYQLEYGRDCLEVHADALKPSARVLLLDDVLATGGTIKACRDLIVQSGAHLVACAFVIELAFLNGREVLGPIDVESLVTYV